MVLSVVLRASRPPSELHLGSLSAAGWTSHLTRPASSVAKESSACLAAVCRRRPFVVIAGDCVRFCSRSVEASTGGLVVRKCSRYRRFVPTAYQYWRECWCRWSTVPREGQKFLKSPDWMGGLTRGGSVLPREYYEREISVAATEEPGSRVIQAQGQIRSRRPVKNWCK